jgi:hypothetical protein
MRKELLQFKLKAAALVNICASYLVKNVHVH